MAMDYELHCGDCLEVLPTIASGSVDAVITDPPYGVGFKYSTHKDKFSEYELLLSRAIAECERVAKEGAPLMFWQAAKHVKHFSRWFDGKDWRLLIAAKNFAQVLPGATWPAFEPIVCWWKGGNGKGYGKCKRDFFLADTTPSGRKRRGEIVEGHPCPRPIEHVRWVVQGWTFEGATVLDPFMGSGTTGVACRMEGRRFIGVELDAGYFAIAEKRIANAAPAPEQPTLLGDA